VLDVVAGEGAHARVAVLPAARAIVSWSIAAPAATLELVVHTIDGRRSRPLPYVVFEPGARASLDGFDDVARITTDVVSAAADIVAIDVHANAPLSYAAVSVPAHGTSTPRAPFAGELDVPAHSQYVDAFPDERGWCAPAAIAMLLGAHGVACSIPDVARASYDRSYHGTGNWAFAVAAAAVRGCFGAAAYLRDGSTLDGFLAAGLPLAVSIAWSAGALPGAPLATSAGHLVVVRGRTPSGDVIANDPAQPGVRTVYPRDAFERAWLAHGGVALLVAPADRRDDVVRCANR
jgi:hypothetical protein